MEYEKLCSIIADVMDIEAEVLTEHTAFVEDLGADSLDIFQIIMGIEEEFDIELDMGAAERVISVGGAVEEIKRAVG